MSTTGAEKRTILYQNLRSALPGQLPAYLLRRRWFGGKARQIQIVEIVDLVPLQTGRVDAFVLLVRVEYRIGQDEIYVLPLLGSETSGVTADPGIPLALPDNVDFGSMTLTDALNDDRFLAWLLDAIEVKVVSKGIKGEIRAGYTDIFQHIRSNAGGALQPRLLKGEQSNSSIAYGDRLILKLFRRIEEGVNPDLEIGLFLTEKARFSNVPPVAGWFDYRAESREPSTVGILQSFVANKGDAWQFTLESLEEFGKEAAIHPGLLSAPAASSSSLLGHGTGDSDVPPAAFHLVADYLEKVALLGRRTAELHLALSSDLSDPAFAPEPYAPSFLSQFETSAHELAIRNLALLKTKIEELPEGVRSRAGDVADRENEIVEKLRWPLGAERSGKRIRIHGDYHLGQVLYTGSDFMMIDFEGEPARPLSARRMKRSALQDVAGMVRSFHYAAFSHLMARGRGAVLPENDPKGLADWVEAWYGWVSRRFLRSYFQSAQSGSFLPSSPEEISALFAMHLLEKAIYELGYELNNRPAWVGIPLAGISQLLTE